MPIVAQQNQMRHALNNVSVFRPSGGGRREDRSFKSRKPRRAKTGETVRTHEPQFLGCKQRCNTVTREFAKESFDNFGVRKLEVSRLYDSSAYLI